MSRSFWASAGPILFTAAVALAPAAHAAIEATASDGRHVLLNDDGTWQYADAKPKGEGKDATGEVVLTLEKKIERRNHCTFEIRLTNNLPEEVRNLVLYYSVYRASGVLYDSVSAESGVLKPGNTRSREIDFDGIRCDEIARLQVSGGDRCEIGELHKWSEAKGECLALVNVIASSLVRFDK